MVVKIQKNTSEFFIPKDKIMTHDILLKIEKLIEQKKIDEAQLKLSSLGQDYIRDPYYLYLRSKVFYLNKLYYLAIDTLLIALEFEKNDKIYNLLGNIYKILGNEELSKKILNPDLRLEAINSVKDELTGIYRKSN